MPRAEVAAAPAQYDEAPQDSLTLAERLETEHRFREAYEAYRDAAARWPDLLSAHIGAANCASEIWQREATLTFYRQALALRPDSAALHSASLFHAHYADPFDASRSFAEHARFGRLLEASVAPLTCAPRAEGERIRIGYLSRDFSNHSVGFFIEPVLAAHDRERFEIVCYHTHPKSDDATARMRLLADGWCAAASLTDAELAERIARDGIDVLVELGGHTKENRLRVMAMRPAPVQCTWIGYPDTTGLTRIDYRIIDAITDPPGQSDVLHSEKLLRLPGCFLCYQPPACAPAVATRAADAPVTFGSFNNLLKITPATIALWARVLGAAPGSRLLLKSQAFREPDVTDAVLECFEAHGIFAERIDLLDRIATQTGHLSAYAEIDVALDTFPYNGTTTTCEALWMGVPVVSLSGEVHMSRVGESLLRAAGLADLVARSADEFVAIAAALAHDPARRRGLRQSLRDTIARSPLLDARGFTRALERAFATALEKARAEAMSRKECG